MLCSVVLFDALLDTCRGAPTGSRGAPTGSKVAELAWLCLHASTSRSDVQTQMLAFVGFCSPLPVEPQMCQRCQHVAWRQAHDPAHSHIAQSRQPLCAQVTQQLHIVQQLMSDQLWRADSSSSSSSFHSYACSLLHSELSWWGLKSSISSTCRTYPSLPSIAT
jgi:hypothetical protein